jgi:hypothetical protein
MSSSYTLTAVQSPNELCAFSNCAVVNTRTFKKIGLDRKHPYIKIGNYVLKVKTYDEIKQNQIGLNLYQRKTSEICIGDKINIDIHKHTANYLIGVAVEINFRSVIKYIKNYHF